MMAASLRLARLAARIEELDRALAFETKRTPDAAPPWIEAGCLGRATSDHPGVPPSGGART